MTIASEMSVATSSRRADQAERSRPRSITMAVLSCVLPPLIVIYVLGAIGLAPSYDYALQFGEGGMIAAASALMLAAGAMAAAVTFYIKRKSSRSLGIYAWLVAAMVLAFVAFDTLIMSDEALNVALSNTAAAISSRWTATTAFAFGALVAAGLALFYREIRRPALVLEFLVAGLVLVGIQVGIDMLTVKQSAFTEISHQSAGILAASQFMLAMTGACVDQIDRQFTPGRPLLDWLVNPSP